MSRCYLLEIPPELRLNIYRYVLIPEAPLHLDSPPPLPKVKDDKLRLSIDEGENSLVNGDESDWVDESDSDSIDEVPPSLLDAFRDQNGGFEYDGMDFDELEEAYYAEELSPDAEKIFEAMEQEQMMEDGIPDDSESDDEKLPQRSGRDLAVLRSNRQIYHEASALLYAEATVIVEIDDLLDLAKERPRHIVGNWQSIWMDSWRYHPIYNAGKRASDGSYVYRPNPTITDVKASRDQRHHARTNRKVIHSHTISPKGKLFPHIFARFQNIIFHAIFEDDYVQNDTIWIDDETFIIRPSDAEKFMNHAKTLKVVKDFVKLMSNSAKLNLLVILEADIEVESTFINGLDDESEFDSDTEDESGHEEKMKRMEKEDRILDMANQRAAELLVDSTIFNPLKRLTNIRSFDIKFGDPLSGFSDQRSKPSPKYKGIFAKMKQIIEDNFEETGA